MKKWQAMDNKSAAKTGLKFFKVGCLGVLILFALMIAFFVTISKKSKDERERVGDLPRLTATVRAEETVGFPFSDADAVFGQLSGEYMYLGNSSSNRSNTVSHLTVNYIPSSLKMELDGKTYSLSHGEVVHFSGFRTGETVSVYKDDPEEERRSFAETFRGADPELDDVLDDLLDSGSRLHSISLDNYYYLNGDEAEFAGKIDGNVIRLLE